MSDITAKRGIYLYINGKEVAANVNVIKVELKRLKNEQNNLTMGTDRKSVV